MSAASSCRSICGRSRCSSPAGAIDKDGHLEVQHSDGLKAAELMAIATGKLKTNVVQVQFDHAGYLAGLDEPPPRRSPMPTNLVSSSCNLQRAHARCRR